MIRFVARANEIFPLSEAHYLLAASVVADSLLPDEELGDCLTGCAHLAARRAQLFDRTGTPEDLAFAMSIFTFYPFKPAPPTEVEDTLHGLRRELFYNFSQLDDESRSSHPINDVVPNQTLELDFWQLLDRQRHGPEQFLNPVPARM